MLWLVQANEVGKTDFRKPSYSNRPKLSSAPRTCTSSIYTVYQKYMGKFLWMRDTDERKYPVVFLHIKNEKNDQKSPLYLLEFSDLSKSDTTLP